MIGKYERRIQINQFCGNIYHFQEEMCENVKMQITEIPITIPYIILKLVIRIPQMCENVKMQLTEVPIKIP